MKKIGIFNLGQKEDIIKAINKIYEGELVIIDNFRDLKKINALVFPRGTSMDYTRVLINKDWTKALKEFLKSGKAILTICGSMIVFAKILGEDCQKRKTNRLLNIKVDNNMINGDLIIKNYNKKIKMIGNFTEAPIIKILGNNVFPIFYLKDRIVAVQQGKLFGYSFYDKTGAAYKNFIEELG